MSWTSLRHSKASISCILVSARRLHICKSTCNSWQLYLDMQVCRYSYSSVQLWSCTGCRCIQQLHPASLSPTADQFELRPTTLLAHLETVCMSMSLLVCICLGTRLLSCGMLHPFISLWLALLHSAVVCTAKMPGPTGDSAHDLMPSIALNGNTWPPE